MKKSQRSKSKKNVGAKKTFKRDKSFWMSMFILVIMVLSLAGFAMMSGGGGSSSSSTSNADYSLSQRQTTTGEMVWAAKLNGEQFVFFSIDGFEDDSEMASLADSLKTKSVVNVYVDSNFTFSDARFLLEKSLNALKIPYQSLSEEICDENTIILITSFRNESSCMQFVAISQDEASYKAQSLSYHMIKDQ